MVKKRRPHGELKAEILDLAEEALESDGPAGLNVRRLAEGAGISVGTIYNLFGHLDAIVRAINVRSMGRLGRQMNDAMQAASDSTESRLIAMAEAYYDFACAHPHRWDTMFRYRTTTPVAEEVMAAEAQLFDMLRQAAGGETDDDSLRALWAAVHGVVELATTRAMAGLDAGDEKRFARLIVMAGLRGIAALRKEGVLT